MKKIGVFDSGLGGKSVAIAIKNAFPNDQIIFISDSKNIPYGTKSPEKLKELIKPKLEELTKRGVDTIVIACNTVSTTILDYVKDSVKVPVIGVAPMVKEAARYTKKRVFAVCATPTTLKSEVYNQLKIKHANDIKVIEPDCSRWTQMIEDNNIDRGEIKEIIDSACNLGADVIVLGCTHYHWIEELIKEIAGIRAIVIQPEEKIIAELKEQFLNS